MKQASPHFLPLSTEWWAGGLHRPLSGSPEVHTQSDSALWIRMNIASKHVFGASSLSKSANLIQSHIQLASLRGILCDLRALWGALEVISRFEHSTVSTVHWGGGPEAHTVHSSEPIRHTLSSTVH